MFYMNEIMEIKRIETFSKWLVLKQAIRDKGYTLWQTQYDTDNPEGYHVGFIKGDKRVEVITHNKEIAEDIQHEFFY